MADPAPSVAALAVLVQKFVADAREKASGGLTVAEFGSLVVELLRLAVTGLEAVPTDGAAKKAWAISAVAMLFDAVSPAVIPIYLAPVWLFARPIVRQLVLAAASGALEQVLSMTRSPAAPEVKP